MKQLAAWTRLSLLLALAAPALGQGFRHWKLSDPARAPKTLSATGLYENIAERRLNSSAHPYELNSPEWKDGAALKRWFILRPGKSIGFREMDDYWDYPDSTVFVKQFSLDTVAGDSLSRILWETRLLILSKETPDPADPSRKVDQWYGFSYRWRANQREADLVPDTGLKTTLRTWPQGRTRPSHLKKWVFPARDHCIRCHLVGPSEDFHGRSVLGFFTAQLNRPSSTSPGRNQLTDFFSRGLLTGSLPADLGKSPRWYGLDQVEGGDAPAVTLEMKARAYLAANCSGCHGARGMQTGATFGVSLDLDYHTGQSARRLEYVPISWPFGMDTLPPLATNDREAWLWGPSLLTPGYPQKSLILHRQIARNTAPAESIFAFDASRWQMPPAATFEVDTAAVKVMERWIKGLPAREFPTAIAGGSRSASSPILNGRELFLPPALRSGNPAVRLRGLDGRDHPLKRVGAGRYAIPAAAPRGLYILQVGTLAFTRSVW